MRLTSTAPLAVAATAAATVAAAPSFAQVDTNLGTLSIGTTSLTGTTVGATNDIDTYSTGNTTAIWDQDVIYQFTTPAPASISFTSNDPDSATADNDFFLLNSLTTTTNASGLRQATALGPVAVQAVNGNFGLQPAGTYFFVIDAWRGNPTVAGTPATGRATPFSVSLSLAGAPAALYTGELTTADPTFNRPLTGTPPTVLSTTATAARYDVQPFFVTSAGTYSFEQGQSAGFDDFLVLYANAFNPATPLANAIDADDDDGEGSNSLVTGALVPGVQYFLVNTAFSNTGLGTYGVTVNAGLPANVRLGLIPEPTTLAAAAAAGLGLLARRRRD